MCVSTAPLLAESNGNALLSEEEREIIALVVAGLKDEQIATRLSMSERTVGSHFTSIFDKLGVSDRLALIIYAYHHGLTSSCSHPAS